MANMSHCRFENTLEDLRDCHDHWDDDDEATLSTFEQKAKIRLLNLCKSVVNAYGEEEYMGPS